MQTRAYLALALICIVWGTTYTAIKFAIRDFPPFLLVGIRQTAAGLLLLAWAYAQGKLKVPDRRYIGRQALTGMCTITGGNGLITWGMQFVWPFKAEFLITYLSPDYSQTIIGRNKRDYFWIQARTPQIPEADYQALLKMLAEQGYDIKKVRKVPQSWPATK